MATVVTRSPTTNLGGSWFSPGNVYASDNNRADNGGYTGWLYHRYGGFGFDGQIPAGAIKITKVEILVEGYRYDWVPGSWGGAYFRTRPYVSGAPLSYTPLSALSAASEAAYAWDVTAAKTWTRDDLLDASLSLQIAGHGGDVTYYSSFFIDHIQYRVTYDDVDDPVATIIAPTGTTGDDTPTVTWASTLDPAGGPLTQYEVKIFDDATYTGGGFDPDTSTPALESGVVGDQGATSWTPDTSLPAADDTYRAYVRIAQTVNGVDHWGGWGYGQFDVDLAIVLAENAGNAPTPAAIEIVGPSTDPEIANLTTGQSLALDYTLGGGDTIEIDTGARTVLLNGGTNIYSALAGTPSWFMLEPGTNDINFVNCAAGSNISWRDAWQ